MGGTRGTPVSRDPVCIEVEIGGCSSVQAAWASTASCPMLDNLLKPAKPSVGATELEIPTCGPARRAVSLTECLQVEGHVDDARERIVVVSGDGLEPQRAIDGLGRPHRGQGVEDHSPIAVGSGVANQLLDKKATKTRTAKTRQDIKALHLADTAFDWAVRDDPDGFICRPSDENDTLRPCVLAREAGVFAFEVLEADICLERLDVFAHQARDQRSVFWPDGFGDADLGDLHHRTVPSPGWQTRGLLAHSNESASIYFEASSSRAPLGLRRPGVFEGREAELVSERRITEAMPSKERGCPAHQGHSVRHEDFELSGLSRHGA